MAVAQDHPATHHRGRCAEPWNATRDPIVYRSDGLTGGAVVRQLGKEDAAMNYVVLTMWTTPRGRILQAGCDRNSSVTKLARTCDAFLQR